MIAKYIIEDRVEINLTGIVIAISLDWQNKITYQIKTDSGHLCWVNEPEIINNE